MQVTVVADITDTLRHRLPPTTTEAACEATPEKASSWKAAPVMVIKVPAGPDVGCTDSTAGTPYTETVKALECTTEVPAGQPGMR
jgi:hypothetical protein